MAVACEFSKSPNDEDLVNLIGTKAPLVAFWHKWHLARMAMWLGWHLTSPNSVRSVVPLVRQRKYPSLPDSVTTA